MVSSDDTLEALRFLVLGRYIDAAAGCLVIYDCFLTLELEIKFIWTSKFNLMKFMYFLNRYSIILDCILVYMRSNITDITQCPGLMRAEGALYITGIYFAEYTFAMRTYVIWQKKWIVWVPLCLFYIATFLYDFISYYPLLNNTRYVLLPPFNGCLAEFPRSTLWINMLLMTIYDAAMVILIGLAAIDMWRSDARVRSDLFRVLYGEGVLFYIYLLAFSIISTVTMKVANDFFFIFMARCMRSILAAKVVLHMRQMVHHQKEYATLPTMKIPIPLRDPPQAHC